MNKSLIIGYGNSLRSDDGIGVRIAQIVAHWHLLQVRSLACHQLTPEIAADLAQVDLVIFVDACQVVGINTVKLYSLQPLVLNQIRSHLSDPRAILSLTQAIYQKCPQAWWLTVPGSNFEFGDRLSAIAQQGVSEALIQIKSLIFTNSIAQNKCMK